MPKHNGAPRWTLAVPLFTLSAMIVGPPEHRLWMALPCSLIFAAMQWLLPHCTFRRENYFSPVNVAQFLMFLKLVLAPALLMTLGPESEVLSALPSRQSMEGALAIDAIAYVALCLGLAFATAKPASFRFDVPAPGTSVVLFYAVLGIAGFFAEFGSLGRLVEYFTEPSALKDLQVSSEGTLAGLFGTFLRPFFAFSLVAWWTAFADRKRASVWLITAAGICAAVGIALANMTFNFNRAAFVFPLIALASVYHNRIRRIPFAFTGGLAMIALPLLLMVSSYRSSMMLGAESSLAKALRYAGESVADNVQGYAVGPQYTGLFYERLEWGERLHFGSTLISSAMLPVPVLGKPFREGSGPALFNFAIYGIGGIEDQILPFDAELFANFHLPGVIAGLLALGFLLGKAEQWIAAATSSFGMFSLQYAAIWGAMLAAWSLSIYSQILVYFFGPVYLYIFLTQAREWIREPAAVRTQFVGVSTAP